jgi:putative flippase GtrA
MLGLQEKCSICGYRLPTFIWFQISGLICDIIQAYLDYFLSLIYTFWEPVTVCWAVSYIMSICIRHTSHRLLVFGDYEGTYWSSLSKTYLAYSTSIIVSTVCNNLLVKIGEFSHKEAWLLTMLWTGILNYFLLKSAWKSGDSKLGEGKELHGKLEV